MEVDKSMKLIFNEFQRSVTEVPLEVYYQEITSDQYSSSGFQFNVKQPGTNALLDCDVWIKYTFVFISNNNWLPGIFQNHVPAVNSETITPTRGFRIGLRGGNCVQRCLQNLSIQINNSTLNVQPYKYVDVLNRLYISNDQSEHEFSASGGRFDEGNHGARTSHVTYEVNSNRAHANNITAEPNAAADVLNFMGIHHGYCPDIAPPNVNDLRGNFRSPYPLEYEFYNPGFSRRFSQFAYKCRTSYSRALTQDDITLGAAPNINPAAANLIYPLVAGGGNVHRITVEVLERLPIPIFKMYSTDGTYGVIPNIIQMQIQGNFLSQFKENFLRLNRGPAVATDFDIDWVGMPSSQGKLYLRWYTPPVNYAIPREISLPYPKITTWSTSVVLQPPAGSPAAEYTTNPVSHYNITLEAIPDLLMIYVKYAPFSYTFDTPDDYLLELRNLVINIDNASGKLNQSKPMDFYLKWKKLIKHTDAKIIGYDEWRKYCFVACLQPEDYGVRFGPGYSNQTTLGISCTAYNYHINHSVTNAIGTYSDTAHLAGGMEPLGGLNGTGTAGELFVTCIYNKNRFIIRADGTANQELMKIAADFNMLAPPGVLPPASA